MKWETEHYKDFFGVLSVMSCAEKWNTLPLPVKMCCVWYCLTLQHNCAFYHCIRNYFLINLEKHKMHFSFSYQKDWTCLSLPKYISYNKIEVGVMRFSMSEKWLIKSFFCFVGFPCGDHLCKLGVTDSGTALRAESPLSVAAQCFGWFFNYKFYFLALWLQCLFFAAV